jgi:PAS domain S-box-containing protein
MFGYAKKDDIVGHSPWELSPKIQPDGKNSKHKANMYISRALKGTPQKFYWEHMTQDGNRFDAEVSLNKITLSEKDFVQAVVRDITERKRVEKEKERALEELERQRTLSARSDRLRSLGEMAAAISHELYQPLVGVRGRAEHLLLGQRRDWDIKPEKLKTNLTDIIESADRMQYIIEHVRLFAREAGKPNASPVDVNDVIRSTYRLVGEQFRSRGLILKKRLTKEIHSISINPYSLEEILLNVLTNARDAVEERAGKDKKFKSPQVSLSTRLIEKEDVRKMRITVSDNGSGISDEHLERLFDPFFTTKDPDKGTGLGLSIVKSILEQFGGTITIKSKVNEGTRVHIEFPTL